MGNVTWVAVAGLVLSIISLLWQGFVAWARFPRLEVGLKTVAEAGHEPGKPYTKFIVTVHNRGAEAVEIYDLGLETETGVRFSTIDGPKSQARRDDGQWLDIPTFVEGETLPVTIEGRSTMKWTIKDGATAEHGPSVPWRGWAEQYRASGRHRHVFSKTIAYRARRP